MKGLFSATAFSGFLRRQVRYPLEAALVYTLYGLFRLLPLDAASALGGWIGRTVGPRLKASRKALRNLARAMPDLTEDARQRVIRGMWDNLGRVVAEYPHLGSFDSTRVEINGAALLEQVVTEGRGGLIVSGHFANWEVLPVTAAKEGLPLQLIYRHANNPYVDRLLARARTPAGGRLARKGVEGARRAHTALKNGEFVGMLVDQKHNRGEPIPFFGRPAMTASAVATLSLRYNVPLLMVQVERTRGARFRLTVHPPLPPPLPSPSLSEADAVRDILTRINATLEEWVRARPSQWLWLHRRWSD